MPPGVVPSVIPNMEQTMNLSRKFKLLSVIFAAAIATMMLGCGGGGSGDADITGIVPTFCPGSRALENGGRQNIIFAAVNRAGITGFIEDSTGTKVAGSDLISNSQANTSEIMAPVNVAGNYRFAYYINSERFEIPLNIQWTTLPDFLAAPQTPVWNAGSRMLTVNYSRLSSGTANYYLRLYYSSSLNTMYDQTSADQGSGVVSMHVSPSGDFTPVLVADVIENGQVVQTVRYVFASVSL